MSCMEKRRPVRCPFPFSFPFLFPFEGIALAMPGCRGRRPLPG